jgi:hypothetical protein
MHRDDLKKYFEARTYNVCPVHATFPGQLCSCWQDLGYIDCSCIGSCVCGILAMLGEDAPW